MPVVEKKVNLVVALGNPGSDYSKTRHNIGWMLLDYFLNQQKNISLSNKFKGEYTNLNLFERKIHFIKPTTYMNLSGESVLEVIQFFKIDVENILVLHDELDLPFGTIHFKKSGGLAGHNGLKSLDQNIGSGDFLRMRLGISRPVNTDVGDWVLSPFSKEEKEKIPVYLKKSCVALSLCLERGIEYVSKIYNKKNILQEL